MRTLAVLPVKSFAQAKQRLAQGLSPGARGQLAAAMFADVLAALGAATAIDEVLVVTAGAAARETAQAHGATVLEDDQRGHNPAAALGVEAALRAGADRALRVPGDCPALDPLELESLLARPVTVPSVIVVPDRHGTGTNALVLTPPDAIEPAFGPDSCERHVARARAAAAHPEVVAVASLGMDVDTPDDLSALEMALDGSAGAPHTRALLRELAPTC
jgi:2-phospho-L-lactate guanylyltransferase